MTKSEEVKTAADAILQRFEEIGATTPLETQNYIYRGRLWRLLIKVRKAEEDGRPFSGVVVAEMALEILKNES